MGYFPNYLAKLWLTCDFKKQCRKSHHQPRQDGDGNNDGQHQNSLDFHTMGTFSAYEREFFITHLTAFTVPNGTLLNGFYRLLCGYLTTINSMHQRHASRTHFDVIDSE